MRTHFDNLMKIRSVRVQLLIASGTADTLTPIWMACNIFARANQPERFYAFPGVGHNDLQTSGGAALERVLQEFVQ